MRKVYFRFYQFEKGNFSIKAFGVSFFAFYKTSGFFWFRIFNKGLCFKNTQIYNLSFGERNNLEGFQLGKWIITTLS